MNSQYTGSDIQPDQCRKCSSRNFQSIEMAYLQSVRTTQRGNESISKFGQSISPPEPRSTVSSPSWTGFAIFCGGLIFIPRFGDDVSAMPFSPNGLFSPSVYIPAMVFGFVAFIVHLSSALNYNERHWAKEYLDWQSRFVCRTCGYQTSPPDAKNHGERQ